MLRNLNYFDLFVFIIILVENFDQNNATDARNLIDFVKIQDPRKRVDSF